MKKLLAILALCLALPCFAQQNVNSNGVIFPLATYTAASITSPTLINSYNSGGHILVYISGLPLGSCTVTIQGVEQVSELPYTILASASLSTPGVTVLRVYPGLAAATNVTADDIIPKFWNVNLACSSGGATLSVSYMFDD